MGYAFTIYRENGVEQPYGFADARRTLMLMRAARSGRLTVQISPIIDIETGKPVTEAELQALVDAGKGDC